MLSAISSADLFKSSVATRVDHDQTAPVRAVRSGSTLVDCLLKFIDAVRNLLQQMAAADNMGLVTTKPVFRVSDKVRLNPVS